MMGLLPVPGHGSSGHERLTLSSLFLMFSTMLALIMLSQLSFIRDVEDTRALTILLTRSDGIVERTNPESLNRQFMGTFLLRPLFGISMHAALSQCRLRRCHGGVRPHQTKE